jgi:hypothetical protein
MAKVKIYTTRGINGQEIEIPMGTTTWGQLKIVLDQNNVEYDDMKALISGTNQILINDNDIIPALDFSLFFVQEKTKSGNN